MRQYELQKTEFTQRICTNENMKQLPLLKIRIILRVETSQGLQVNRSPTGNKKGKKERKIPLPNYVLGQS